MFGSSNNSIKKSNSQVKVIPLLTTGLNFRQPNFFCCFCREDELSPALDQTLLKASGQRSRKMYSEPHLNLREQRIHQQRKKSSIIKSSQLYPRKLSHQANRSADSKPKIRKQTVKLPMFNPLKSVLQVGHIEPIRAPVFYMCQAKKTDEGQQKVGKQKEVVKQGQVAIKIRRKSFIQRYNTQKQKYQFQHNQRLRLK